MKTTIKVMMLLACVLFVGAMVRQQHETFAERVRRGSLEGRRSRTVTERAELASAGLPGAGALPGGRTALQVAGREAHGEP